MSDVPADWADHPRTCGICGVQDIPRGVDWPFWVNGQPAHWLCAIGKRRP